MAYSKGNKIYIQDLVNRVNSRLKNTIQSKIYWWRNNVPNNFPSSWKYYFKDTLTLPDMSLDTTKGSVQPGGKTVFIDFLSKLEVLFAVWSHVRIVHYSKNVWDYSDGGPITSHPVYEETNFGHTEDADLNLLNRFNAINYTGQVMSINSLEELFNQMYSIWESSGRCDWTYIDPCHSNCYGSCHGSGGYR